MRRTATTLPIFAACLVFALASTAPPVPASGLPETHAYTVEFEVARGDGSGAQLRADVLAATREEASLLAGRVLREAGLRPRAGVSAQWLPWSWKWDAAEIPVSVAFNPTGAPLSVSPATILAGLNAWSNVQGSSFRYHYAGITDNVASILDLGPDGENVISWASLPCEQGCVLGITSKESAHEVDLLLNSNPEAAEQLGVGATLDWRTVILHELGHMAGLEHSCLVPFGPCTEAEADAVMYYQYRGILRSLAPDDIAGIVALYPAGASTPSPQATPGPGLTPTPTPFPELPVLLERGWNLVVLPAGPVSSVTDILTCAVAAYSFEAGSWRTWIRSAPEAVQELASFEAKRAYWLLADSFCAHFFP